MKIEIEISLFQYNVLAHNQSSVAAYIKNLATREADNEARRLAENAVRHALDDPKKSPQMKMDRKFIVETMFADPKYKNASERRAAREQAAKDQEKAQRDLDAANKAAARI